MKEEKQKSEGIDDEILEMPEIMRFAEFKSTKNTKMPGDPKDYGIQQAAFVGQVGIFVIAGYWLSVFSKWDVATPRLYTSNALIPG
jgi:hypothetical protein